MLPEPWKSRLFVPYQRDRWAVLDELVAAPEAPALLEALLSGVELDERGRWTLSPAVAGSPYDKSYRDDWFKTVEALLLLAPDGVPAVERLAARASRIRLFSDRATERALHVLRFQALTSLELYRFGVPPLRDISQLGGLTELKLHYCQVEPGLEGLGGLPTLRTLSLEDMPELDSLAKLGPLPALTRLAVGRSGLPDLSSIDPELMPQLEELVVGGNKTLRSLRGLERFPPLRLLSVSWSPQLTDLSPLAGQSELENLALGASESLTSLAGLPASLPKLSYFYLERMPGLTDLAHMPSAPLVKQVAFTRSTALSSIEGIERLSGLEHLQLKGVTQALDLSPLTKLAKLEVLDLRGSTGITEISALDGMEQLKVILLHESGVPRRAVAKELRWRCSWVERPQLHKLRKKTPPRNARAQLAPKQKTTLAAVRKLLKSKEPATVDQGLELMSAVGDPRWFDTLLEGAEYSPVSRWKLLERRAFNLRSRKFSGPLLSQVLHGLVARAPKESVEAPRLSAGLDKLDFVNAKTRGAVPHPFRVQQLNGHAGLTQLGFYQFGPLDFADVALPALEQLELRRPFGPTSLAWLAGSRRLKRLVLERCRPFDGDLGPIPRSIEQLTLRAIEGFADLNALSGLPALHTLRLEQLRLTRLGSLELPALTELWIEDCRQLESLAGLVAPKLERVRLLRVGACDASALAACPALANVWIFRKPYAVLPELGDGVTVERRGS